MADTEKAPMASRRLQTCKSDSPVKSEPRFARKRDISVGLGGEASKHTQHASQEIQLILMAGYDNLHYLQEKRLCVNVNIN